MSPDTGSSPGGPDPQEVVGRAVQDLAARRLGRGFVPLGLLCLAGLTQLVLSGSDRSGAWILVLGAPMAGLAMLAYGVVAVQRAFGRSVNGWRRLAGSAGLVPSAFSLYVLAWCGLRGLSGADGASVPVSAVLVVLGGWALLAWLRVFEVRRLAETMSQIGGGGEGWER